MDKQTELASLPSVDKLLNTRLVRELSQTYGRALATAAVRASLDQARHEIQSGSSCPSQRAL